MPPKKHKRAILVGDILHRARLEHVLTQMGFSVTHSLRNDDALAAHKSSPVELIATSVGIAGMSALEFCDRLRRDPETREVSILLVCKDDPSDRARCQGVKANGFISLPATEDEIQKKIRAVLSVEKRQAFRVFSSIRTCDGAEELYIPSTTLNISPTGMLIESEHKLAKGDMLSISFHLPNSDRITATGKVARARHKRVGLYEYGIHFESLSLSARQEIEDFVKAHGSGQ